MSSHFPLSDHNFVERALVTGEEAGVLEDHFGERGYAELRQLAREAASRPTRGGTRVLILPGIMGSKLGTPADEIWLDFLDVALGRLSSLTLAPGGNPNIGPLGVLLTTYLKLKYRLRIGGYNAEFWPFDWRMSVADSGKLLSAAIDAEPNEVHLIAHSMGGLIARACLAHKPVKLGRIITLGTPHYGSFSPLQAFRGAHSVVRKLAFLDVHHDQTELAEIFGTFPGLSEMLPMPGKVPLDLFDLSVWPAGGPRPAQALLSKAREVQRALPTGGASSHGIIQIVGVNQQTVIGAEVVDSEFVYTLTNDGDGTVPLTCARLADAKRIYYVEEEHGALPNNAAVARAIQTLIATGETRELSSDYVARRSGPARSVRESELGVNVYEGVRGRRLSTREERTFLAGFAAPVAEGPPDGVPAGDGVAALDSVAFTDRLVISRQSQRQLNLTLALGSLTDVDADAYVLGLFKNVSLGGAALAVDRLLDGGISQTLARRMFNGNVGEISILPSGRHPVRADFIAFAGLGPIDSFNESTLETVGENLIRTFVTANVGDFATVLMGGASGMIARTGLARLLSGFVRGLLDADHDQIFHRVTICENDPARYAQLTQDLYALCGGTLFDGIQVTLRTRDLPTVPSIQSAARAQMPGNDAIYLLVRQMDDEQDRPGIVASVLTKGRKAAIHRGWQPLDEATLDSHLATITAGVPLGLNMEAFGKTLADIVLPETIQTVLAQFPDDHIVAVHDARASRIPWETLYVDGRPLALSGGISHRYEADDLSVAKWLEERQERPTLRVLLVVDPTMDLENARREGDRVETLLKEKSQAEVRRFDGRAARRSELLNCFQSGAFDVVHYAGHAFFDPNAPSRSGILCAGHEVLSGADLAGLSNLPSLVFFNACEVGRIRRSGPTPAPAPDLLRRNIGFAEAFLRGGVANFIGTYWPVGDEAAGTFAPAFYERVLAGQALGEALLTSRKALEDKQFGDWANYILYGDPDFVLKRSAQS
ncbi:hypothetical protein Y590_21885 [Methylobacterium sp. AMS5]|nr:hypothetical protein Y590_21885 [Methylobacterium sp. AMS5]